MTQHLDPAVQFPFKVSATFMESGSQLQTAFIGPHPILVVVPEHHEGEEHVDLILTAVDFDPETLLNLLNILIDSAETMAEEYREHLERQAEDQAFTDRQAAISGHPSSGEED